MTKMDAFKAALKKAKQKTSKVSETIDRPVTGQVEEEEFERKSQTSIAGEAKSGGKMDTLKNKTIAIGEKKFIVREQMFNHDENLETLVLTREIRKLNDLEKLGFKDENDFLGKFTLLKQKEALGDLSDLVDKEVELAEINENGNIKIVRYIFKGRSVLDGNNFRFKDENGDLIELYEYFTTSSFHLGKLYKDLAEVEEYEDHGETKEQEMDTEEFEEFLDDFIKILSMKAKV